MPQVGLGLWKIPKDVCPQVVYDAICTGYRCLDGACDYGNEKEVGLGIKRAIDEGIVKREDLFVVSKLWNTFHRPEHVEEGCRKTLSDLGLDYLDLYLIHFPIAMPYVPIDFLYPPEWVNKDPKLNQGVERMLLDDGVTYEQTYRAME
jgi:D-xylose reductase